MEPIVLVHGGAGPISDDKKPHKIKGCKLAAQKGYEILKNGGNIVDAVEAAIRVFEDDEYFNAGYGSALNLDGEVELDASIMVGSSLQAGACTIVKDVKHPISLAKKIMQNTPHVLLAGVGAVKFGKEQDIEMVKPGSLATDLAKEALEKFKQSGRGFTEVGQGGITAQVDTVGCVAMDSEGNLCAGTSTGGISGKMPGRVSDSSQLGSGSYADNNFGAVSTTGHGESISKIVLAHSIVMNIGMGKSAQEATEDSVSRMFERLNNTGGAITISKAGEIGIFFSSKRMAWAYQRGGEIHYGVDLNEDVKELV